MLLIGSAILLGGLAIFGLRISAVLQTNRSVSGFPVQIQEYMASNSLYPDENGVCADWVELYNSSDSAISIGGFRLADQNRKARYTVPAGTVLPGRGYYVIYCQRSGGDGYADFGISRAGGEKLYLLNQRNVLIDSVTTISLPENASAERGEDGLFRVSMQPTPGAAAGTAMATEPVLHAVAGPIAISEVIPGNTLYADANGRVADLVELCNGSDAAQDVGGYVLQNGIDGERFTVPAGTVLAPGDYYLIYCARAEATGGYADFALSRNGGELLLLYNTDGQLTDYWTTVPCGKNGAIVRENGALTTLAFSTPGFPNTEEGRVACLRAYAAQSAVRISETMSANRTVLFPDGTAPDWVELYNASAEPVDLSGCGLSDTASSVRYAFPEGTVLAPGGCLVVACDETGLTANAAGFSLAAAGGETVYLTCPDGTLCDAAVTVRTETDQSLIYADGAATVSGQPTPGFSNDEAGLAAYRASRPAVQKGLVISELMPSNASTIATFDGHFVDWVELYNAGTASINLGDFCLSDREIEWDRFRLPTVSLAPGEYVLILCSKELSATAGEICAPFGLSSKGGSVLLSAATGELVDRADYPAAERDRSYCRAEAGTFAETDCPTPGFANTGAGYRAFMAAQSHPALYISEVMPSNRTVSRNHGDYFDWVELGNDSAESVQLGDYCLTDNPEQPDRYRLPDVTLKSGEYFLVYCSGDESLTDRNGYHCPFKLNGGEDRVYLYDADGQLVDYLHVSRVPTDGSIGRRSAENGVYFFSSPTPGKKNTGGTAVTQPSDMPTASMASGVFEDVDSFTVTLDGAGTVYYTTDGSVPTEQSPVYTEPITISRTSVVRAAALQPDKRMSDVLTLAYTLNEGHTLPVLNLIIAPEDFTGERRGIYSHPRQTWQRDACIVYTDANGTITHNCGVSVSGQTSRGRPQKSYKIYFTDHYGGRLCCDLFGDDCDQTSFPELQIRAGLDSKYGIYREPLIQQLALPYRETTFVQDSVPCVLYINGEYFGIYQFMESLSRETLADRLGVRTDSITMYRGYMYPEHSHLEIYQLWQYVQKNDLRKEENYAYIEAHLDLDSVIDWAIFEAYCCNDDLSGNIRYFKSTDTDGRWHFVLYDLECGLKSAAGFDYVLHSGQTATFLNALLKNATFRDRFLKRLAYHCENTFRQEDVLTLFYWYDDAVREETVRHFKRWKLGDRDYQYNYNQMQRLLKADRVKELKQSAKTELRLTNAEYQAYFGG